MKQFTHHLEVRTSGKGLYDFTHQVEAWFIECHIRTGLLTLFVQQSHATQIFIGSSQIQPGNTVALAAGLVIAIASASWIFQSSPSALRAVTA